MEKLKGNKLFTAAIITVIGLVLVALNNYLFANSYLPGQTNFHGLPEIIRRLINLEMIVEFIIYPLSSILSEPFYAYKPFSPEPLYYIMRLIGVPLSIAFYFGIFNGINKVKTKFSTAHNNG